MNDRNNNSENDGRPPPAVDDPTLPPLLIGRGGIGGGRVNFLVRQLTTKEAQYAATEWFRLDVFEHTLSFLDAPSLIEMKQVCKFWKAKCIAAIRAKCPSDKKKKFKDWSELRRAARMYAGYRFETPPVRTIYFVIQNDEDNEGDDEEGIDDNVNEGAGGVNDQANNESNVVSEYGVDEELLRRGDERFWSYERDDDDRFKVRGAVRYDNRYDYDRVVNTYGMIEDWDVSLVDDFCYIFFGLSNFNENIGRWDTSRVKRMDGTFWGANQFNHQLFWDTSQCTSMKFLFCHAHNYNQPTLFDTRHVRSMFSMFCGATSFDHPIPFNTSMVTNMSFMFCEAKSFNQPVQFDTSRVDDMYAMFNEAFKFNQEVPFDTRRVDSMALMFAKAYSFNHPVMFDLSMVQHMHEMFRDAAKFDQSLAHLDMPFICCESMLYGTAWNHRIVGGKDIYSDENADLKQFLFAEPYR